MYIIILLGLQVIDTIQYHSDLISPNKAGVAHIHLTVWMQPNICVEILDSNKGIKF